MIALRIGHGLKQQFCCWNKVAEKKAHIYQHKTTTIIQMGLHYNITRSYSEAVPKCEVFLGGSCNPTTWRKDVAIPMLEKLAISYYNPQVSNWEPHLVELEHRAKQNASVLFFVIDKQTRNVAATVEAAYYSGLRRNLILVIKPYDGRGCKIGKDLISDKELDDLKQGQLLMHFLVERQGIPVFDSIPVALSCTSKVLRDNISVQDLSVTDLIQSSKESYDSHNDSLLTLRETFKALDTSGTGKISISDVCVACEILTSRNVSLADLKPIVLRRSGVLGRDVENIRVSFEQFSSIVADLKTNLEKWGMSPIRGLQAPSLRNQIVGLRDVYLGCCDEDSTWAEDIAIPMLKRKGLTYFCPAPCDLSNWRIPATAVDNSRVSLFVISDKVRALSTMTLAAHYIGLGRSVVLCVRLLPEGAVVNGEKLTEDAIKDYNRGRKYLIDLSSKDNVPVFDNVKSAVECVVSKCLGHYRRNSFEDTAE